MNNIYESKTLHWFFVDRWYFKNHIKNHSQDELFTLWHNMKLIRGNDMVRRDMGRLIINVILKFNFNKVDR